MSTELSSPPPEPSMGLSDGSFLILQRMYGQKSAKKARELAVVLADDTDDILEETPKDLEEMIVEKDIESMDQLFEQGIENIENIHFAKLLSMEVSEMEFDDTPPPAPEHGMGLKLSRVKAIWDGTGHNLDQFNAVCALEESALKLFKEASKESDAVWRRAQKCLAHISLCRAELELMKVKVDNDFDKVKHLKTSDDAGEQKKYAAADKALQHYRYFECRLDALHGETNHWIRISEIQGKTILRKLTDSLLMGMSDMANALWSIKEQLKLLFAQIKDPTAHLVDGSTSLEIAYKWFELTLWDSDSSALVKSPLFIFPSAEKIGIELRGPAKVLGVQGHPAVQDDYILSCVTAVCRPLLADYSSALREFESEVDDAYDEAYKSKEKPSDEGDIIAAKLDLIYGAPQSGVSLDDLAPPSGLLAKSYRLVEMYDELMEQLCQQATFGAMLAIDIKVKDKEEWKKYRTLRTRRVVKASASLAIAATRLVVSGGTDMMAWYSGASALVTIFSVVKAEMKDVTKLFGELSGKMSVVRTNLKKCADSVADTRSLVDEQKPTKAKDVLSLLAGCAGVDATFVSKYLKTIQNHRKQLRLFRYHVVKAERNFIQSKLEAESDEKTLQELITNQLGKMSLVDKTKVPALKEKIKAYKDDAAVKEAQFAVLSTWAMEFELLLNQYQLFSTSTLSTLANGESAGTGVFQLSDLMTVASAASAVCSAVENAPGSVDWFAETAETFNGILSLL